MAAQLHISLAAEPITHIGSFPITNSLLMTWIAMAILILFALIVRSKLSSVPRGAQNLFEIVTEYFLNLVQSVTQNAKQTAKFFPIVFTFFIFILVSNYLGVFPGVGTITLRPQHEEVSEAAAVEAQADTHYVTEEAVESTEKHEVPSPLFRPPNADLNATLAWAILAVLFAQIYGVSSLGIFHYAGKFFPFHKLMSKKNGKRRFSPVGLIDVFVGGLEIISEFAKVISFSFRLFGNVFAGEVLLVVIGFLAAYLAPIPFYGLELFVGLIQALVFAMLTLVFLKIASTEAH